MINPNWQLDLPIDAVIFDCDGTLTRLEGIDELARMNNLGGAIEQLTAQAMGQTGLKPELYQRRLELVKPTRSQIERLGVKYFQQISHNVIEVIEILHRLKKSIYILSAGVNPAVTIFGKLINIPPENIFAVDIYFDSQNKYLDFDRSSPLTTADGKKIIANQLKKKHPRLLHIGDGLNDYSTHKIVTRFVGYGGAFYHQRVANLCEYYITSTSLAALLPLCLTAQEAQNLTTSQSEIYQYGLRLLQII